jgi:hypothetical protein
MSRKIRSIRFTDEEWNAVTKASNADNRTRANYIRAAVRGRLVADGFLGITKTSKPHIEEAGQ